MTDLFGMALGYYHTDFNRSGSPFNPSHSSLITSAFAYDTLFNGNISAWTLQNRGNAASSSNKYEQLTGHRFRYDQLNRIKTNTFSNNDGSWQSTTDYRSAYTYDANGNILSLNRNAYAPTLGMDSMTYTYETIANGYSSNTNKLRHVDDAVASGNYAVDIDDQAANNYKYDAIGNLIEDVAENIDSIYWTVYGKVRAVVKTSGDSLYFRYDAAGNRVMKEDYGADTVITFYVRDASGNPMATYERTRDGGEFVYTLRELPIYGSDRIGLKRPNMEIARRSTTDADCFTCEPYKFPYNTMHYHGYYTRAIDKKDYEATDHLSNQRVIFSDRKNADSTAVVRSYNNYYPFGMLQPARNYQSAEGYRFAYQGSEMDNEIKGTVGTNYTTFFRALDPRLGRWWSIDPKWIESESGYMSMKNSPVLFNDALGDTTTFYDQKGNLLHQIDDGYNAVFKLVGDNYSNQYFKFERFDESKGGKSEVNLETILSYSQDYTRNKFLSKPNYKKDEKGNIIKDKNGKALIQSWTTYCNFGTKFIAKSVQSGLAANGVDIDVSTINGTARDIYNALKKSNFKPLTLEEAQKEAGSGSFIIGGFSSHAFTLNKGGMINNIGAKRAKNNIWDPQYALPKSTLFYLIYKPTIGAKPTAQN